VPGALGVLQVRDVEVGWIVAVSCCVWGKVVRATLTHQRRGDRPNSIATGDQEIQGNPATIEAQCSLGGAECHRSLQHNQR